MSSDRNTEKGTTRRGFVKEITAGAAGIALAGIFSAAFMPSKESLAAAANPVEQPVVEVEARGGCGHRPAGAGIKGLVAQAVSFAGPVLPPDVRRKRHLSDRG